MLTKRIIPCLDVKDGRTVKGIKFLELKDAGDPVALSTIYSEQGADELVLLDISATIEGRKTFVETVRAVAQNISIPFTVGGGVGSVEDVYPLLRNGADKVSVNSAAVRRPELINELVKAYGTQCITTAIDAKFINGEWIVFTHGGKTPTEKKLFDWAREAEDRGTGEILFTSMDHDGTKNGFACEALDTITSQINIPVIASGGAGKKEHFSEVFKKSNADAALAASVFHFGEIALPELKKYLESENILIRL
ncbi:MAG: imidazole glycerol phosphate synthase subunit HisF [Candidatus Cyclobacteriaceae bacterium M2_1C_046]